MSFDPLEARRGPTSRALFTPILVIAMLTVLLSLRALAFASPPDPVWVAGIYDAKDGDDVIARIAGRAGANSAVMRLLLPAACRDPLPDPGLADCHHRPAAAQARGPPGSGVIITPPPSPSRSGDRGLRHRPRRVPTSALASPAAHPHVAGDPSALVAPRPHRPASVGGLVRLQHTHPKTQLRRLE